MGKLIRLEFKRNNIKKYMLFSLLIFFFTLGLTYYFAFDSGKEPALSSYLKISSIVSSLFMFFFSILSSAMYAKFVLVDYSGKRALLTFSYPVRRDTIFFLKHLLF